jgi:hypothetical protein
MCEMTLLLGLVSAALSMVQDVEPLILEKEVALLGVEGRIDHFSVDVPGQLVFIAALENGSVEILDTRQGECTAEIKDSKNRRGYIAIRKLAGSTLPQEETASFASMTTNRSLCERPSSLGTMPTTSHIISRRETSG